MKSSGRKAGTRSSTREEKSLNLILQKLEDEQQHRQQLENELRNMRESMMLLSTAVAQSSVGGMAGLSLQAGSIDDLRQFKNKSMMSSARNLDFDSQKQVQSQAQKTGGDSQEDVSDGDFAGTNLADMQRQFHQHQHAQSMGGSNLRRKYSQPTMSASASLELARHRHSKSVGNGLRAPPRASNTESRVRRAPRPPAAPPPPHIVARHEMELAKKQQQEQELQAQRLRALRNHVESKSANLGSVYQVPKPALGARIPAHQVQQLSRPTPTAVHDQVTKYSAQPARRRLSQNTNASNSAVPSRPHGQPRRLEQAATSAAASSRQCIRPVGTAGSSQLVSAPVGDARQHQRTGALAAAVSRNRGVRARPPPKKLPPLSSLHTKGVGSLSSLDASFSSMGDESDGMWSTSSSDAEIDDEAQNAKALLHRSAAQRRQRTKRPSARPVRQKPLARTYLPLEASSGAAITTDVSTSQRTVNDEHLQTLADASNAIRRQVEATSSQAATSSRGYIEKNPHLHHLQSVSQSNTRTDVTDSLHSRLSVDRLSNPAQIPTQGALPGTKDFPEAVKHAQLLRSATPKDDDMVEYDMASTNGANQSRASHRPQRPQYVLKFWKNCQRRMRLLCRHTCLIGSQPCLCVQELVHGSCCKTT